MIMIGARAVSATTSSLAPLVRLVTIRTNAATRRARRGARAYQLALAPFSRAAARASSAW